MKKHAVKEEENKTKNKRKSEKMKIIKYYKGDLGRRGAFITLMAIDTHKNLASTSSRSNKH